MKKHDWIIMGYLLVWCPMVFVGMLAAAVLYPPATWFKDGWIYVRDYYEG